MTNRPNGHFASFILLLFSGSPRKRKNHCGFVGCQHAFVKTWAQAAHGTATRWVGEPGAFADLSCSTAVSTIPPCFKNLSPAALINGCAAFYAGNYETCLPYVWRPKNIVASAKPYSNMWAILGRPVAYNRFSDIRRSKGGRPVP